MKGVAYFTQRCCLLVITSFFIMPVVCVNAADSVKIAKPNQISAPRPLMDGSGVFFVPYTSDGVITDWVDKGIQLDMGSNLGGLIGAELANQVLSEIPVLGSMIGKRVGEYIGASAAISAIGGIDYIKSTSDQSFQKIEDLAVFLYARHASHKDYKKVLAITIIVHPELEEIYYSAIVDASADAFAFDIDLGD